MTVTSVTNRDRKIPTALRTLTDVCSSASARPETSLLWTRCRGWRVQSARLCRPVRRRSGPTQHASGRREWLHPCPARRGARSPLPAA